MEKKWACACPWLGPVSLSIHHQPGPSLALMAGFGWVGTRSSYSDLPCDLAFLVRSIYV